MLQTSTCRCARLLPAPHRPHLRLSELARTASVPLHPSHYAPHHPLTRCFFFAIFLPPSLPPGDGRSDCRPCDHRRDPQRRTVRARPTPGRRARPCRDIEMDEVLLSLCLLLVGSGAKKCRPRVKLGYPVRSPVPPLSGADGASFSPLRRRTANPAPPTPRAIAPRRSQPQCADRRAFSLVLGPGEGELHGCRNGAV